MITARPYHFAAIVGGGVAGSVAAEIFADNGIHVVIATHALEACHGPDWPHWRDTASDARVRLTIVSERSIQRIG